MEESKILAPYKKPGAKGKCPGFTAVVLEDCDKLASGSDKSRENLRTIRSLQTHLLWEFGKIYSIYFDAGTLRVMGQEVQPIDLTFKHPESLANTRKQKGFTKEEVHLFDEIDQQNGYPTKTEMRLLYADVRVGEIDKAMGRRSGGEISRAEAVITVRWEIQIKRPFYWLKPAQSWLGYGSPW